MATIFRLSSDFFAQGLVILYPPVLVFWLVMHTQIEHLRPFGKRAYLIAGIAWPLISGPLLIFRQELFTWRMAWSWPAAAAGLTIFVLAWALAHQAARCISRRTLVGLAELEPSKNLQPLLQTGIYSRTRNPVYLVHWLLILAAALMTGYLACWALLILDSLLLPLMLRAEEQELRRRYGTEYADYMRRVPRFFPKLA